MSAEVISLRGNLVNHRARAERLAMAEKLIAILRRRTIVESNGSTVEVEFGTAAEAGEYLSLICGLPIADRRQSE